MHAFASVIVLLLANSAVGDRVWCHNNCAEVTYFKLDGGLDDRINHVPLDFQLNSECKVEMCQEGEVCNSNKIMLAGNLEFENSPSGISYEMDIEMSMCGTYTEEDKIPEDSCTTYGEEYAKAFEAAAEGEVIDFTLSTSSPDCEIYTFKVCKENCVPESCQVNQEDEKEDEEKEKYENSATCSSVSALIFTSAAILLH